MTPPRPGDAFHLDIDGTVIAGRYVEVDPPHRVLVELDRQGTDDATPAAAFIEFTFTPITPTGDSTDVQVELSGLSAADAPFYTQLVERYLNRLAAGAEPGAGPANRVRDLTSDADLLLARSTGGNPPTTRWS